MLVLSRRPKQDITIGDDIRIRVVRIRGNSVRLAIDAPRDVRIERMDEPRERSGKCQ